jgi:glycosyltransferase involved in cell wall biosynthesis
VTVSEDLRAYAIDAGAAPERVHTILNGIDAELFFPRDAASVRSSLGIAQDRRVVLFVGRLSVRKGVRELLAAVRRLLPRFADVDLAIIGTGRMAAAVRRLDDELPGRVHSLNACSRAEVAMWMAACDVLCLPSYSEGCPNVVVEALATGRPVVASAVGGVPELITPANGILVEPKNAGQLERALEQALCRSWNHDAIAAAWQRRWSDVAADTMRVCMDLLAEAAVGEVAADAAARG